MENKKPTVSDLKTQKPIEVTPTHAIVRGEDGKFVVKRSEPRPRQSDR